MFINFLSDSKIHLSPRGNSTITTITGPQVGAGARTSVFAAEMRCTPRTLVAAPYKISGSPWSIAIAWPETADNCGRAVSGRPGTMDSGNFGEMR